MTPSMLRSVTTSETQRDWETRRCDWTLFLVFVHKITVLLLSSHVLSPCLPVCKTPVHGTCWWRFSRSHLVQSLERKELVTRGPAGDCLPVGSRRCFKHHIRGHENGKILYGSFPLTSRAIFHAKRRSILASSADVRQRSAAGLSASSFPF